MQDAITWMTKVRFSKYQIMWDERQVTLLEDKLIIENTDIKKAMEPIVIEYKDILNVFHSKAHIVTLRLKNDDFNIWIKFEFKASLVYWQDYIYEQTHSGKSAMTLMRRNSQLHMKIR